MKGMKQGISLLLAAGMLATSCPLQALASDYKYISSISLKVDIELETGDEISDGDSLGISKDDTGNKVYTTSDKYEVVSAEWTNDKEVSIGDTPKITVWLEPNSSDDKDYEYRFRSSYSSGKRRRLCIQQPERGRFKGGFKGQRNQGNL